MAKTHRSGKLVRDRIPQIILAEGVENDEKRAVVAHVAISNSEFSDALQAKLGEEYDELVEALEGGDLDHVVKEMADLTEVMYAICENLLAVDPSLIDKTRRAKKHNTGGFDQRIILDSFTA